MSMFGYYAFHSFVNQIRKLFKTWVAVFIAICLVMGIGVGITVGIVSNIIEEDEPNISQTEVIEDEEETFSLTEEQTNQLIELIAGGVILLVLGFCSFTSDNSVSSLFLPADVPLLFASPRKPQSVLIFRLSMQIGAILISSIYILFQLPNLVHNLGLSVWNGIAIIITWFFTLAWGKILQVFLYIFGSTHEKFKNNLRYILTGIVAIIGIAFYGYFKTVNCDLFTCAGNFFNGKYSCLIPIWGWLKAIVVLGIKQNLLWQISVIVGNIVVAAIVVYFIWQMKSDYYEEAMSKCEETARLLAAAQEGKAFRKKDKKDRSEKLLRDGLNRGNGANIYFWKAMYNRFRFAHFRIFTKTAETYFVTGILASLTVRFLFDAKSPILPFAAIAVLSFFRSLGNPLEEDTKMDYFILIPEGIWAKLWYSLLGGIANCALDLLPGIIVSCIILKANPLTALLWFLLIVTLNFYSTSVGAFIDFSVPTSAGKLVKNLVQILFIYFGLLPDLACIALAALFSQIWIGTIIAIIMNCAIGGLFFIISPVFLTNGRK